MRLALPTPVGWILLIAAAFSIAVALINIRLTTALTAAFMGALVLSCWIMTQFSLFRIKVERTRSIDGVLLDPVVMPVRVTNLLPFYRQSAVLLEECAFAPNGRFCWPVPPLAPYQSIEIERVVTAEKRGSFDLKKISLCVGDPAGLFRKKITFNAPGEVIIAPKVTNLASIPLQVKQTLLTNSDGRPLGHAGSGFEFFGVRPYRPGDEIRFIHWRATAAQHKLMVKELEANTIDRIGIILDTDVRSIGTDPVENNFESLISCAASITGYLSRLSCQLSFYTDFHGEPILFSGDAAGTQKQINDVLTELTPSRNPIENILYSLLERIEPDSILYVLTMTHSAEMLNLLKLLQETNVHIRLICAPKTFFPTRIKNEYRYINLEWEKIDEASTVQPRFLTFQTKLNDVLK